MTATIGLKKPPAHFYTVLSPKRWKDPYVDKQGDERRLFDLAETIDKGKRNDAYRAWMSRYGDIQNISIMKWQTIRVIRRNHSENRPNDWWPNFEECLFRVFIQPITCWDSSFSAWKQWYLLCPEDTDMVWRFRYSLQGIDFPRRRASERYISLDKRLTKPLCIPTECCHHVANNETFAGKITEEGLA